MLEELFCLAVIIWMIIDICITLKDGRIATGERISTERHHVDSETTTWQSTFLIDGKEYTERKARNTIYPRKGKCKVILKDDDTVIDFRCIKTDIALIVFFGIMGTIFLPKGIAEISRIF